MAEKTSTALKTIAIGFGILMAIISPIVTVVIASEQGKATREASLLQIQTSQDAAKVARKTAIDQMKASQDAAKLAQRAALEQMKESQVKTSQKAEKALDLAESNARTFEYFKGEMTATMKALNKSIEVMNEGHKDGLDKLDGKTDKLEGKVDELLKIMVRFKRAGDDE